MRTITKTTKMEKPDNTLLTKIDALILKAHEMDNNFSREDVAEYIYKEFGVEVNVTERLKEYYNENTGLSFGLD